MQGLWATEVLTSVREMVYDSGDKFSGIMGVSMKQAMGQFWMAGNIALFCLTTTLPAIGQAIPDNTLPSNSVVTPEGNIQRITGGTTAGGNLFHSFERFSVPNGSTAFFDNAPQIQNILTRVTGASISNIDGLIRANGTANLFLLNPNGIVFGPNARLDIGGSFLGTTAGSLLWADGTSFSATNPQSTPLLSIDVPLGVQFNSSPGAIVNRSVVGLQVPAGQSLALLGGDVTLEGGRLTAEQGRISLGSLAGNSLVNLTSGNQGWTFGYEGVQNFGDIQLSQQAVVDASGPGGGDIQVQGGLVTLTEGSRIVANTLGDRDGGEIDIRSEQLRLQEGSSVSASTLAEGPAGNLTLTIADSVEVTGFRLVPQDDGSQVLQQSTLAATELQEGTGNSGNIEIRTRRLITRDGADISVSAFGEGGASGTLQVFASESVELSGAGVNPNDPGDFSRSGLFAATEGTQDGGNVRIETGRLTVRDGARVSASTRGPSRENREAGIPGGRGGDIIVNASESVELSGVFVSPDNEFPSGLFALSGEPRPARFDLPPEEATGDGGNLTITTSRLTVADGAQISATALGLGNGGDIKIDADTLFVSDGAELTTNASQVANSGDITLRTNILSIVNGARVFTGSPGNAGDITVTGRIPDGETAATEAELVEVTGFRLVSQDDGSQQLQQSTLAATVFREDAIQSGNIEIRTRRLITSDGGDISVSAFGDGVSGSLQVFASESVELSGAGVNPNDPGDFSRSGLFAATEGTQNGGNVRIETGRLTVKDGARVSASTRGPSRENRDAGIKGGRGGDIIVIASESVELSGVFVSPDNEFPSGLFALSGEPRPARFDLPPEEASGDGGNLTITTGTLTVADGAQIAATALGLGNGGDITIDADTLFVSDGAELATNASQVANSGNITLRTNILSIANGARVFTGSPGNAGDITVTGRIPDGETAATEAELVEVTGFRLVSQDDGSQELQQSTLAATVFREEAIQSGNIVIRTRQLITSDGGDISVSAFGDGASGSVQVFASESVELSGAGVNPNDPGDFSRSGLFAATEGTQNGGNVRIETGRLTVKDGARVSASTRGPSRENRDAGIPGGRGGDITVIASESVELSGVFVSPDNEFPSGLFALSGEPRPARFDLPPEEASGDGGNLTITTGRLTVGDRAQISATALGRGNGGDITINADTLSVGNGAEISANASPFANSGAITIRTNILSITDGARVSTESPGTGNAGDITVTGRIPDGETSATEAELVAVTGFRLVSQDAGSQQLQQSTLAATGLRDGTGNSGNIEIRTERLITSDGGDISVSAFGEGASGSLQVFASESVELSGAGVNPNDEGDFSRSGLFAATEGTQDGGNLRIETGRLTVRDGARVSASTRGPSRQNRDAGIPGGRGGDITVIASESVELSGVFVSPDNQFPSGLFALSGEPRPARFDLPPVEASGAGGNLTITTGRLTVRDGAQASATAQGLGTAGNLNITAGSIGLNNGFITGGTATGEGGNITLQVSDSLQLRRDSQISTTAAGSGNGGDITIKTDTLAIIESSNISANAFGGTGGNVRITTEGIFQAPDSAITVSSQLGVSGVVEVNTPDVEPGQALVDLPEDVIDPEDEIARPLCSSDGETSSGELTITGRGGLPPNPTEPLSSDAFLVESFPAAQGQETPAGSATSVSPTPPASASLPRPAQGWYVKENGDVILTANPPTVTPQGPWRNHPDCHAR